MNLQQVNTREETFTVDRDTGCMEGEYVSRYSDGSVNIHCFYKKHKLHGEFKRWVNSIKPLVHIIYIDGVHSDITPPVTEEERFLFKLQYDLPLLGE